MTLKGEEVYIQDIMDARAYVPVSLQADERKWGVSFVVSPGEQMRPTTEALYSKVTIMRCYSVPCLSIRESIEFHTKILSSEYVIRACQLRLLKRQ